MHKTNFISLVFFILNTFSITFANLVFTDGTIRVSGTTLCLQKYDWRTIPIYENGDVIYVLECDLSQNKIKNDLFKWEFVDGMIKSSGNAQFCWSVPFSQSGIEQQVRIQYCDVGSKYRNYENIMKIL